MTPEPELPCATIDVGTNTILQLVARRAPDGGLEVLDDRSITARLGEGLARTGRLVPGAIERATEAVAELLAVAHELGVPLERVRAAGTAVLRRAEDPERFTQAVHARTGLPVEILSEEDEARLGHFAVTADGASEDVWIVDVGGGSTELAGERGALRLSTPVGAVTLTTEHGGHGTTMTSFEALLAHARGACDRFPANCAAGGEVVCLGGTASNLACLDQALEAFDPELAEGHVCDASTALREARNLWTMTPDERRGFPIEADRAEILPAGLACLAAALERIGAGEIRISGRGLRYGMLHERLARA